MRSTRSSLRPWQQERIVRDFLAERDRRLAAAQPATRFKLGQRVRIVGGSRHATVIEVLARGRIHRYRLEDSKVMYFESDLQAADVID